MKAVYSIGKVNILVSLVFYVLTSFGLYLTIEHAVMDEFDESLYRRFLQLDGKLQRGELTVEGANKTGEYGAEEWVEIHKWQGAPPPANRIYHTILLPEPQHAGEQLEYRRLTTFTRYSGTLYEISITRSLIEWQEVIELLNLTVMLALFLLLVLLYIANVLAFNRLFAPLVETTSKLASIRDGDSLRTVFPPSPIDEFNTLNSAINAMLYRIEHTFDEQKEFLHNASHELQTPLTVLRHQTESLLKDSHLSEHALIEVSEIQETIARLARLNNALLLIARIENRQFLLNEPIPLAVLIEEVAAELSAFIEAKQLRVDIHSESSVTVTGNRDLLHILFYNLIQNAVKFAPEHSAVTILMRYKATECSIAIGNEGAILPARRTDLFKRFKKAGTSWSDSPGLGLSIVRSICDLHGYRCELDEDNPKQTVFIVTIPLSGDKG